jgi:hypothetical protein
MLLVGNILGMYLNYPEMVSHLKQKRRFVKANLPYREKWINRLVAKFLLALIGTGACLYGIVTFGLVPLLAGH